MKLSKRQRDLMHELVKGHSNKEIARKLGLSEGTVRVMVHNIYNQNGGANRIRLALRFAKQQQEKTQ